MKVSDFPNDHKILRQNNQEANAFTRKCIETALITLMETKSFEDITISDITRKAGVSRTAYYRNYATKEDILSGYMQNINKVCCDTLNRFNAISETRQSWLALLETISPYAKQYKLLIAAGYGWKIIEEYAVTMNQNTPAGDWERYYSNQYWAGAIFTVLSAWIQNDMNIPIERLADIGCNLMTNGIRTVLDYGNACK